MADNLRFGFLPHKFRDDIVKPICESFVASNSGWKYLCPNKQARHHLINNIYKRLIESNINSKSNLYVLFDIETYDDISSIIGFVEIISPNKKFQIKDCLFSYIDNLVLAPLHLNDGISFIWRCIKLTSIINYLLHDIITKYIGEYWYLNHLCIKNDKKWNGNGSKMLHLIHQKCSMDMEYNNLPIFVVTMTANVVQFYVKNGYKLVIQISFNENNNQCCYGLLYHFDKNKLQQYTDTLSKRIKYKQKYNLFEHVLPQGIKEWIMLTNLILISIPFLVLYFPALWMTRWLSPESAWDISD